MADKSKIEWTDATWNPITGCTPISEGCRNCYAERMVKRFPALHGVAHDPLRPDDKSLDHAYSFSTPMFHRDRLNQPLRWKKQRRIFVGSMADLFHENVPEGWVEDVLATMTNSPQHTFMILTKRPERMVSLMARGHFRLSRTDSWPLPNLWLGVTAENQQAADERIPILLQTPAARRFVSVEPMLGPVDLSSTGWTDCEECGGAGETSGHYFADDGMGTCESCRGKGASVDARLDWVICGGESGPGARPMHPDWARSLRDQCQAAGVPFFFKQWGEWETYNAVNVIPMGTTLGWSDGKVSLRVGKKAAGCILDGREWKEIPE